MATTLPYKVTDIKHERSYQPGGTVAGQYHVQIEHADGMKSSFTVPEDTNAAMNAHQAAMAQVDQANQIKALPAGQHKSA